MRYKSVCRMSARLAVLVLAAALLGMQVPAYGDTGAGPAGELRGVWISYLDWEKLPAGEEGFQAGVNEILDRCVELKMNAVFVHVRPDADAMYPSEYFPWSRFVTGTQGEDPGYDPLDYFIQAAHERGLAFHAWINPFRVTGYLNRWDQLSDQSPAKIWKTDADPSNDRWVLKQGGEYYLNPAVPQVRDLIVGGVREIVESYDVDGIHFDDYFYPEVDNQDPDRWFDKPEYVAAGVGGPVSDWRRDNVNSLVREVYRTVKETDQEIQFGISPEGYVDHLRSDSRLFADIDTWMSQPGYVTISCPSFTGGLSISCPTGLRRPLPLTTISGPGCGLRARAMCGCIWDWPCTRPAPGQRITIRCLSGCGAATLSGARWRQGANAGKSPGTVSMPTAPSRRRRARRRWPI